MAVEAVFAATAVSARAVAVDSLVGGGYVVGERG